ncbi:hypothetical protein MLD38_038604 [Melastoma candidum]|uniref:Uncharacterized protein n=1 Tax=Melastoma candidum TaxID=119954 RepID=A0ACB9L0G0_9MYRT|nr:hypothetical protein MLD38_038604 [Melastoma candidum]
MVGCKVSKVEAVIAEMVLTFASSWPLSFLRKMALEIAPQFATMKIASRTCNTSPPSDRFPRIAAAPHANEIRMIIVTGP